LYGIQIRGIILIPVCSATMLYIPVLMSNELTFSIQGEGFMVGVQINPVKGLPSGFPVKIPQLLFSKHVLS